MLAKRPSHRQLASIAYRQAVRIAQARHGSGVVSDACAWLKAGANILSAGKAGFLGPRRGREAPAWWGLSVATLSRFARDCRLDVTREQIERQVAETKEWRLAMSEKLGRPHEHVMQMDRLGELLGVTDDERREARAWSVGTIGGSREARKQADKERRKLRKAAKRRDEGKQIRERVERVDGKAPWEAAGMSRATYFRNRQKAAGEGAIDPKMRLKGPTCKEDQAVRLKGPRLKGPTCKGGVRLKGPTCNRYTHSAGSVSDLPSCGSAIQSQETAALSGLPVKEASGSVDHERGNPELAFPIIESSIIIHSKRGPLRIQERLGEATPRAPKAM